MADEPKQVGRRWRGDSAVLRSSEDVADEAAEQAQYRDKPGAVPLLAYFGFKDITNPVMQASMSAYTKIRIATVEDFDAIFKDH